MGTSPRRSGRYSRDRETASLAASRWCESGPALGSSTPRPTWTAHAPRGDPGHPHCLIMETTTVTAPVPNGTVRITRSTVREDAATRQPDETSATATGGKAPSDDGQE